MTILRNFSCLLLMSVMTSSLAAEKSLHFSLPDTTGVLHTEQEWVNKKAVVLIFIATDCPISNSYVPALKRLYGEFSDQQIDFYAVQSDPSESPAKVNNYAVEFGYPFPVLLDSAQLLAHFTGAIVTPEAAILSSSGKVLYLGRIDDKYLAIGKSRYTASQSDLQNAVTSVLEHQPVVPDRTRAVGCAIPFTTKGQP